MENQQIGVNERGWRVGQSHHNAKLTDSAVEQIRRLHEDGMPCRELAEKFEISLRHVYRIINFDKRAQPVARWRRSPA